MMLIVASMVHLETVNRPSCNRRQTDSKNPSFDDDLVAASFSLVEENS